MPSFVVRRTLALLVEFMAQCPTPGVCMGRLGVRRWFRWTGYLWLSHPPPAGHNPQSLVVQGLVVVVLPSTVGVLAVPLFKLGVECRFCQLVLPLNGGQGAPWPLCWTRVSC